MGSRLPSWKEVAHTLAMQLFQHAYCPTHPESEDTEGCPHCDDRDAYRLWERKAGITPVPTDPVPTVTLTVLAAQYSTEEEKTRDA